MGTDPGEGPSQGDVCRLPDEHQLQNRPRECCTTVLKEHKRHQGSRNRAAAGSGESSGERRCGLRQRWEGKVRRGQTALYPERQGLCGWVFPRPPLEV